MANIWIPDDLKERMEEEKAIGQSFYGYIKELMEEE